MFKFKKIGFDSRVVENNCLNINVEINLFRVHNIIMIHFLPVFDDNTIHLYFRNMFKD